MELRTQRLIIRRFRTDDWQDLYEYLSDSEVVFFEPYPPFTPDEAKTEAKNRAESDAFLAVELNGKVIGNIYYGNNGTENEKEIGYVFARSAWGHGYATEAAKAVINSAFATEITAVTADCADENPRSWKLLERLGMKLINIEPHAVTFKKDANGNDIWWDARHYRIEK